MITIEEKLNLFSKQIFDKIQNSSKDKINKVENHNKKLMEEHREKIKNEKQNYIENKIKVEKKNSEKLIAKKKGQINRDIIIKKNQLFENVVTCIKNEIRVFTDEKQYGDYFIDYLTKAIKEFNNKNIIEVQVTNKDIKRYKEKIEEILIAEGWRKEDIRINPSSEDIIGGLILTDMKDNIILDISLLTKIEENKDYIGEILYKALEKRGEIYEE